LYNFTTMFNLRYAADYLLHRLKAKTRHGTHSPFVYQLVDKVIYDFRAKKVYDEVEASRKSGSKALSPKLAQLVYRLVADCEPNNIVELGRVDDITNHYLQNAAPAAKFYNLENSPNQLDSILIINAQSADDILNCFELILPKAHDGTMMIITDIYRNEEVKRAWASIKADQRVSVTIDLFVIGLVYFRKGQVKEDFLIRF
jgi:hypothetical protein